jgi:hypothetical protein
MGGNTVLTEGKINLTAIDLLTRPAPGSAGKRLAAILLTPFG